MRNVDVEAATAASSGTVPSQGPSRNDRQDRWSYVHAVVKPSDCASRQRSTAVDHRRSGRMTTPMRMNSRLMAWPQGRLSSAAMLPRSGHGRFRPCLRAVSSMGRAADF
jgi:hypothetical protein